MYLVLSNFKKENVNFWEELANKSLQYEDSVSNHELLFNKLNTEVLLYEKLMDALDELKRTQEVIS